MSKFYKLLLGSILLSAGVLNAQQIPGAARGVTTAVQQSANTRSFILPKKTSGPNLIDDYIYSIDRLYFL